MRVITIKKIYEKLKSFSNSKNLAYICLLVIMVILILQSTFSLFFTPDEGTDFSSIDVVLRTTLSSIYGYIMSMVFSEKKKIKTTQTVEFEKKDLNSSHLKMQVLIVSSVCIFCLFVLIIIRDFGDNFIFDSSDIATLSLFRDFISGGVGALIGLSREG
ncbi:MAG: hypothetical protein R3Y27_02910 [Clostridia bacterium]